MCIYITLLYKRGNKGLKRLESVEEVTASFPQRKLSVASSRVLEGLLLFCFYQGCQILVEESKLPLLGICDSSVACPSR